MEKKMNVTTKALICGGAVAAAGTYREYHKYSSLKKEMKKEISQICHQHEMLRINTLLDKINRKTLTHLNLGGDFFCSMNRFFDGSTERRSKNVKNLAYLKDRYSENNLQLKKSIFHHFLNNDLDEYRAKKILNLDLSDLDKDGLNLDIGSWCTRLEIQVIASMKLENSTIEKVHLASERLLNNLPYTLQERAHHESQKYWWHTPSFSQNFIETILKDHLTTSESLEEFKGVKKLLKTNYINYTHKINDMDIELLYNNYNKNKDLFSDVWEQRMSSQDIKWLDKVPSIYQDGARSVILEITKIKITAFMQALLIRDLVGLHRRGTFINRDLEITW